MAADHGTSLPRQQPLPKCSRTIVTTEPALLTYFLGLNMHTTLSQQMLFGKYCSHRYGAANSTLVCSNSTLTDADDSLQADTSRMRFYCTLVTILPSVVVCAYLGAAGDRRSRKYPTLVPQIGAAIAYALWALQCYFVNLDPRYALLSSTVLGASGYYPAALQTCYSYLTAVVEPESRTLRLAVAEGVLILALVVSGFGVGPLVAAVGLTGAYSLLAAVSALGAIYCQVWLYSPRISPISFTPSDLNVTTQPLSGTGGQLSSAASEKVHSTNDLEESLRSENGSCDFCMQFVRLLRESVRFALKKRPGHTNAYMRAALAALLLFYWSVEGAADVLYLYLTKERGFSTTLYGFFTGAQFASRGVIGSVALLFMRRCFDADDLAVAMTGTLSAAAAFAVLAAVVNPLLIWAAVIANALELLCSIGVRSYLSKSVQADEQSRLFALISICQGVITLVSSLVFNNLYPVSLGVYPGLCFAAASLLSVFAFVILAILANDVRGRRRYVELAAIAEIKNG